MIPLLQRFCKTLAPHLPLIALGPSPCNTFPPFQKPSLHSLLALPLPHLLPPPSSPPLSPFYSAAQKSRKLQFLEVLYGPSLHKDGVQDLLCSGEGFRSLTTLILNFTPASHLAVQLLIGAFTPSHTPAGL